MSEPIAKMVFISEQELERGYGSRHDRLEDALKTHRIIAVNNGYRGEHGLWYTLVKRGRK